VGSDGEYDLTLLTLLGFLPKEVLEDRDLCNPGVSAHGIGVGIFEDSADEVDFAVGKARLMLDSPLSDGG